MPTFDQWGTAPDPRFSNPSLHHSVTAGFLQELAVLSLGLRYLGRPEQADEVARAYQSARNTPGRA